MSCTLTLVESTCLMPFRNTCNKKISFLNVVVLVHLSKMPWQKYQHLLDITQPLLLAASFYTKFWVEAQSKVVFLIICLPSQVLWFDSPFFSPLSSLSSLYWSAPLWLGLFWPLSTYYIISLEPISCVDS